MENTRQTYFFLLLIPSSTPFVCSLHVRRAVHNVDAGGRCTRYKTTRNIDPFQALLGTWNERRRNGFGMHCLFFGYIMCVVNGINSNKLQVTMTYLTEKYAAQFMRCEHVFVEFSCMSRDRTQSVGTQMTMTMILVRVKRARHWWWYIRGGM